MSDKHVATKPLSMTENVNMNEAMTISVQPARSATFLNMPINGDSRDLRITIAPRVFASGLY